MADIIARALAAKALAEIGSIGGGIKFKGTVATEADLPTSGNQNGDMYVTEDTGKQYIWNVTEEYPDGHWVSISPQIDLSAYLKKEELASTTGSSTQTAMTQAAVTQALNELSSQFEEELELKADKAEIETKLELKANKADVESKFDEIESEINLKADKTYVDEELDKKANKSDVREIYVQDTEPEEASDGAIWIDTSAELPSWEEVDY